MSEKFETCELCKSEIRIVGDFRTTQCACLRCSMDTRERLQAIIKFATPANIALLRRVEAGESVEMPKSGMELIARIAKQTPEKPDYWSSCGQCDRNESDAQDVIEAAAWNKETTGETI